MSKLDKTMANLNKLFVAEQDSCEIGQHSCPATNEETVPLLDSLPCETMRKNVCRFEESACLCVIGLNMCSCCRGVHNNPWYSRNICTVHCAVYVQ